MLKNKNKKRVETNRGITLIALVVTIVILLILAGITINAVLSDGGIFSTAKRAGEVTRLSVLKEQLALWKANNELTGLIGTNGEGQAEILNKLKNNGTITEEERKVLANGGEITINGEKVSLNDYTEETTAGNIVEEIKNAQNEVKVRNISEGTGKTVPVPDGFYYVGGTLNTGVVISDKKEDENKYKGKTEVGTDLIGNQFVWVPVDGTTLTYAQDHTYDSKHQYAYTDYTDWTDAGGNSASVAEYKGFYIGRYEAGWSETITNGVTYEKNETKNSSTTIASKLPISKAGVPSWNFISQTSAKTVSENMYSGSKTVTSSLIDSYAWDTTCKWLKQEGKITETAEGKINSTSYGNYYNSNFSVSNAIYANHIYREVKTDKTGESKWYYATNYGYSSQAITLGGKTLTNEQVSQEQQVTTTGDAIDTENYNYYKEIEIATGSSNNTRLNNIYDMAGNMWEWTTESGKHKKEDETQSTNTFAVPRGGSFYSNGSGDTVVFRNGGGWVGYTSVDVGFRLALYIK